MSGMTIGEQSAHSDPRDNTVQVIVLVLGGIGSLVAALAGFGYLRWRAPQLAVLTALEVVAAFGFFGAHRLATRKRKRGATIILLSTLLLIAAPLALITRLDLALVLGAVLVLISLGIVLFPHRWLPVMVGIATVLVFDWFAQRQSFWERISAFQDPVNLLAGTQAIVLTFLAVAGLSLGLYARGRSMRVRLWVYFGLLFVLPTALAFSAAALVEAVDSERASLVQMQDLTRRTVNRFTGELQRLQDDLVRVERLEIAHLRTLLEAESASQAFGYAYALELSRFGVLVERQATFDAIFLVAPDGTIVLSSNPVDRGEEFAYEALAGDDVVGPLFDIARTPSLIKAPAVTLALPVRGPQDRVIGLLVGQVALSRLLRSANELRASVPGVPIHLYLVDEKAQVVASDPPGAQPSHTALMRLLKDHGDGEGRFPDASGDVLLTTYHWFPALGIGLLLERPALPVVLNALLSAAPVWGLFAGAVCVALVGLILLSRVVTSPLLEVMTLAEELADGAVEQWPNVTSHDEVGRLISALGRVVARFEAKVHAVEAQAREHVQRFKRQLAWLQSMSRALGDAVEASEAESVLRSLVRHVGSLPDVGWVGVWLLDDSGSKFVLKAAEGTCEDEQRQDGAVRRLSEEGLLSQVFEAGQVVTDRLATGTSAEGRKHVRLALPLWAGNGTRGVCEIHLARDCVSQEELDTLQALAGHVSQALDAFYRNSVLQERLEELERRWWAERLEHWRELVQRRQLLTFVYDGVDVRAVDGEETSIAADLVLPLGDPQTPLGRLIVSRSEGADSISAEQLRQAEAIVREVVDALERARVLHDTRQAWAAMQRLLEGLRAMMAADTPSEILDAIMTYAQVPQLDRGWLVLWEARWDGERALRLAGLRAADGGTFRGVSKWWDRTICPALYVAEPRERWVLDVAADQTLDSDSRRFLLQLGLRSALLWPIRRDGDAVGWLILGGSEPLAEPPPLETSIWRGLVEHAGHALRHVVALTKAHDRILREQNVAIVGERVGRSTDVHTILQVSLRELGRVLRASQGVIYLNADMPTLDEGYGSSDRVEGEDQSR